MSFMAEGVASEIDCGLLRVMVEHRGRLRSHIIRPLIQKLLAMKDIEIEKSQRETIPNLPRVGGLREVKQSRCSRTRRSRWP